MRLFHITHPRIEGTAKVTYNMAGILMLIDFTECTMPAEIVRGFKNAIPTRVEGIEQGEGFSAEAKIIEHAFVVTFNMFWSAYNTKINKLRCEKLWGQLSKEEQVLAYYGIGAYDKFLKNNSWRKRADPEAYLSKKYWENEWK